MTTRMRFGLARFGLALTLALVMAGCLEETGTIKPAEAVPETAWLRREREAKIDQCRFIVYCDTASGNLIYTMDIKYFQVVPGGCARLGLAHNGP